MLKSFLLHLRNIYTPSVIVIVLINEELKRGRGGGGGSNSPSPSLPAPEGCPVKIRLNYSANVSQVSGDVTSLFNYRRARTIFKNIQCSKL